MVTSVFSKPKLHKILPPLVWDNETVKQTHGKLASTLVCYMLNGHADPERAVKARL